MTKDFAQRLLGDELLRRTKTRDRIVAAIRAATGDDGRLEARLVMRLRDRPESMIVEPADATSHDEGVTRTVEADENVVEIRTVEGHDGTDTKTTQTIDLDEVVCVEVSRRNGRRPRKGVPDDGREHERR